MKQLTTLILILNGLLATGQIPPAIQWQKTYGGSDRDGLSVSRPTPDGGYIVCGTTQSTDGDITSSHGFYEAWIIKTNSLGVITWQKTYGGAFFESAVDIQHTPDGGYIFVGSTNSDDGDVSGNHGGISDVWLVKLNSTGSIQWQKCIGGPAQENANSIKLTVDGGYIITAHSTSNGGDVSGHHAGVNNDLWVVKTDNLGNIQWQKNVGGTASDDYPLILQTADGGYILSGSMESRDGDVTCTMVREDIWVTKLDNAGNMSWQNCIGGNAGDVPWGLTATSDGGFITAGVAYSNDLPGNFGGGDAWVIKWSATGSIQWQRLIGGSNRDELRSIIQLSDGSYMAVGSTNSIDGGVCSIKGLTDLYLVKLNIDGTVSWQKTFGGSDTDGGSSLFETSDGGFIVTGFSMSTNGDVTGNHGSYDGWLIKLNYPGIPVLPAISISASENSICPGKAVRFIATTIDQGTAPTYEWMINGVMAGANNDTITFNTLVHGDVVTCRLTSNSPCVTTRTANSNAILISVDPTLTPNNFLPATAEICSFGTLELKPTGTFKTFLWSNNTTTPTLLINKPGTYWLQVISNLDCPGTDTVTVTIKECLKGFYMPTAFTPNGDGKNDILKPYVGGVLTEYHLAIYNRWGAKIFQTNDVSKGWDGKLKSLKSDSNVFAWICTYQFSGETVQTAKGTVVLIR